MRPKDLASVIEAFGNAFFAAAVERQAHVDLGVMVQDGCFAAAEELRHLEESHPDDEGELD